jgi:hypothetical protein
MSRRERFVQWTVAILLAAVILFALTVFPVQVQGDAGWNLVQMFPGTKCMSYHDGGTPNPTAWLLIDLSGTWTHPVNFGIRNTPPGATVGLTTFVNGNPAPYQPIAPGSGDGSGGARGRVEVTVHAGTTAPGTYNATLWANDGSTERTLPVTIVVQNPKCSRY